MFVFEPHGTSRIRGAGRMTPLADLELGLLIRTDDEFPRAQGPAFQVAMVEIQDALGLLGEVGIPAAE